MSMEELYRLSASLLFLTMAITGFNFRIKAKKAGDDTSWSEEGSFIMVALRLFGFGTWLVVIMDIISPGLFGWSSFELSFSLHLLGAVILITAQFLIHWLFRSIGKNITDTVGIKTGHELVQSGPYHYIRHPLYTASIMIFTGYGLLLANWLIPVLGSLTFVLLLVRLPREEENLINHFGEAYKAYMKMTPRFFPRLNRLISF